MVLAGLVALKCQMSGKYLSFVRDGQRTHAFIESSGADLASPFIKFELERETTENGNSTSNVHIKSCYNNKYWSLLSKDSAWVIAGTERKVGDHKKWSCTLFEPFIERLGQNVIIQLRHVHSRNYLGFHAFDESHGPMLYASKKNDYSFKVIDLEDLAVLPKHVAFKGDNGKYLGVRTHRDTLHFLQFDFEDKADKNVENEVSIVRDGLIKIKSCRKGRYWRYLEHWVRAGSDEAFKENDTSELFFPVKVGENIIALRCATSKRFCKRYTDYWKDSLCAIEKTITEETKLFVEELVISRKISDIQYHIRDAVVYSESHNDQSSNSETTLFNHTNQTDSSPVTFENVDITSSNWNSNWSFTFGVNFEFEAKVPVIQTGLNIGISTSLTRGHQWGETHETSRKQTAGYTAVVPPKSKVTVSAKAIKASCRIPFSYIQRDILTNGKVVTSAKDDGVYTGSTIKTEFVKEEYPI